jgi:P-type conjugative transfer protein TrbL
MGGTGVVDRFLDIFSRYIDSGFGLLGGEVAFIATTLIVIDVTLAALFWSWGEQDDILARLVKKTLFVGIFAYIIGNWNSLARIVFESFAGLGLKASGTGFTAAELLQPGRVAQVGLDAAYPLLESISELLGFVSFFENFLQIVILLVAWAIVIIAFFILSIQLFITLIEFKLATLCGFVLIPFGLFGKTAFMAERVLGNVVSSGIKVLVLAVIVGIGSTIFSEFTTAIAGEPTIEDALSGSPMALFQANRSWVQAPQPAPRSSPAALPQALSPELSWRAARSPARPPASRKAPRELQAARPWPMRWALPASRVAQQSQAARVPSANMPPAPRHRRCARPVTA